MDLDELLELLTPTNQIDPVSYQYFHQLFDKRTIVFNQAITENIIETVYLPLRDFENDDSSDPVTLILNSIGGTVSDGFFLAHYIANYKKKLNIIITGCAASMAAVILCGGGKNENVTRYCYPSSYALIHDGYVTLQASEAKTASDIMDFNNQVDERLKEFIVEHTNITAEQYESKTRHQWFLSAKEMKELNLVDRIIGDDDI